MCVQFNSGRGRQPGRSAKDSEERKKAVLRKVLKNRAQHTRRESNSGAKK